jgi:hypothetical protein
LEPFQETIPVRLPWRKVAVLRKIAISLLTVLVVPLIAKLLEAWADRTGFIDDPTKGLHWVLSIVGSVTDLWFFYRLVSFVAGLAAGLWFDRLLRMMRNTRSTTMISLGSEMQYIAGEVRRKNNTSLTPWPESVAANSASLHSLFVRARNVGLWTPGSEIMHLDDNGEFLIRYLMFVGKLLADGQEKEAATFCKEFQLKLRQKSEAAMLA